jgi:thiosulfate reductase cytochrome b subunit
MRDSLLFFLVYLATPLMLVAGLAVMYLIIGDHPWFASMAGGYTVMLAVLYILKISIFRKLYLKRSTGGEGPTHG